jgi:4-amino-4-deoxy-L-arabinose transferase-like glycosyltransferase
VLWTFPAEPKLAGLTWLCAGLGVAVAATAVLSVWETARARGAHARAVWLAGSVCALSLATFAAIVWLLQKSNGAWDAGMTSAFSGLSAGPLGAVAHVVGVVAAFPILLVLLLFLIVREAVRGRWPETYLAIAGGAGLVGVLVALKQVFPRDAPSGSGFYGAHLAFPNETAALLPAVVFLWFFLAARAGRPRNGLTTFCVVAAAVVGILPVVVGHASFGDVAAGWAVAAAWLSASVLAFSLAEGTAASPEAGRQSVVEQSVRALDWLARAAAKRSGAVLAAVIVVGLLARLATFWDTPLGPDAYPYAVMGQSFQHTGAFTMPWGDVHSWLTAPAPSHHYPPLYPMLLAGFFQLGGFSVASVHVASIVSALACLAVAYACTRNLYGHTKGLLATAILAVSPMLVQNAGEGYSENLVTLLFVLTLWAIVKSLERPWFIVQAGLYAGLGYLTKSSMGAFFLVAGFAGLAWRLRWRGWKVLRDPAYVSAILVFAALVAAWGWRNWTLFGDWQTSQHIALAYAYAAGHPGDWLARSVVTLFFYATAGYLGYLALLAWLPSLARAPKMSSEHDSALWLALGLPLVLTAVIDAALWLYEGRFVGYNVRYIAFVAVPATWLLLRHARLDSRAVRVALVATVALLLVGTAYFARPQHSERDAIAADLATLVHAGDSLGFVNDDNHGAYGYYFAATANGARNLSYLQLTCAGYPACPPEIPGPAVLNTTWVVVEGAGANELVPGRYVLVAGAAQPTATQPSNPSIWRHT